MSRGRHWVSVDNIPLIQCVISVHFQNKGFKIPNPASRRLLARIIAREQNWALGKDMSAYEAVLKRFVREVIGEENIKYRNRARADVVQTINVSYLKPKRIAKVRSKQKLIPGFYSSKEWVALRYKVITYYGAKCMCCGATSETSRIMVDHIKPRTVYPHLALEFSNMQVLCAACNHGKGWQDETDWRPTEEPKDMEQIDPMTAAFAATIGKPN